MQRRAAAAYGAVLLLVAAGAFAFAATAEAPEPSLQSHEAELTEGDNFTVEDRQYTVAGFGEQRDAPTVTLEYTVEDVEVTAEWDHAADLGGTTVFVDGTEYYVRIPQTEDEPDSFVLQEAPGDGLNPFVRESDGQWYVEPEEDELVPIEEYEGLQRIEVAENDTITVHEEGGENERDVTIDDVGNETVAVSWTEDQTDDTTLRQGDRETLNGVEYMAHFPEDGVVQLTSDPAVIEDYEEQLQDKQTFQQRIGGLHLTTVISGLTFFLLVGLALLPRKE